MSVVFAILAKGERPAYVNPTPDQVRSFTGFDQLASRDEDLVDTLAEKYTALGIEVEKGQPYRLKDGSLSHSLRRPLGVSAEDVLAAFAE